MPAQDDDHLEDNFRIILMEENKRILTEYHSMVTNDKVNIGLDNGLVWNVEP